VLKIEILSKINVHELQIFDSAAYLILCREKPSTETICGTTCLRGNCPGDRKPQLH